MRKILVLITGMIFAVFFSTVNFSEAATVQTSDGLSLDVSSGTDAITQVSTTRAGQLSGSNVSGFSIQTRAPYSILAFSGDVSTQEDENGSVVSVVYSATANDANTNPSINLSAVFKGNDKQIDLEIEIQDLTNPISNRFLIVSFALPINMQGWTWGDDIRNSQEIIGTNKKENLVEAGFGHLNKISRYPIAAIYNNNFDGIAIGYPLDHPTAVRLVADPSTNRLYIYFDIALSPLTTKPDPNGTTARIPAPGWAHLKAVIYRFDPEWGFRSAIQKYYDIYYYDLFEKRVDKEGLWVLNNPTDLSHIVGINDFGITYRASGEEPRSICFDDSNNIDSFRRLTLAGEETFCGISSGDLISSLDSSSQQGDSYAQAVLNSGIYDKDNNYVVYSSDNDVCYYSGNNTYATIVVNSDPDINGPNLATYLWNDDTRLIYSNSTNEGIDGEFIDAVEGQSNQGDPLDYREDHIAAYDFPLTYRYTYDPITYNDVLISYTGVPVVSGTYEFLKWVKTGENGLTSMNKLMMGNYALKKYLPSAHLMDVMGTETGFGSQVDMDGNFSLEPQFDELFNLWRTISYQKPYNLFTYLPNDWSQVTRDMLENYFKNALFYGFYPGLGNTPSSTYSYFKSPDMYERDRDLFKKYIPLIQRLGKAGWEPVTYAKSSDPTNVYVERYGLKPDSTVYITTRNISDADILYTLTIDASSLGLPASDAIFVDMITGYIPETANGSQITLTDTLGPKGIRMFAIKNDVCTDNDDDGYAVVGGICGAMDCDDNDISVYPGANEIAGNNKNDDCNPATLDRNVNSEWQVESIDSTGNVGSHTSIAIDSNGKVHISYRDETNGDLKYATNASGAWVTTTVDSSGAVGEYASIALDSSGVHISYYDQTNKYLKYATNISGQWVSTIVDDRWNDADGVYDNDAGQYSAIALDSYNKVYILYYRQNADGKHRVYIATKNSSGSWERSMIDYNNAVKGLSLAIDSSDTLHVAYYKVVTLSNGTIFYNLIYKTGVLDCIEEKPQPNGTTITINYSWARWSSTIIDSVGDVGNYPSITDSSGKVHISYYDATNKSLKYATNATGKWVTQTIDSVGGGDVGQYTSITTDSSGKIYISYYDAANGNLKYATNVSGIWTIETVDSNGDVGSFSSIAVDSGGDVHISYYNSTNGDLKYANAIHTNIDNDGDGYSESRGDCNDNNPAIHPGTTEICNGLDDNCNGLVDEVFGGFQQPIRTDGSSIFKLGRTIPVKIIIRDCAGAVVTNATATIEVYKVLDVITGTVEQMDVEASGQANTDNLFRYDSVEGQYIYNLSTSNYTQGTYEVFAVMGSGARYSIRFSLKQQ